LVSGIRAKARHLEDEERSLMLVTALRPRSAMGQAAKIAKDGSTPTARRSAHTKKEAI